MKLVLSIILFFDNIEKSKKEYLIDFDDSGCDRYTINFDSGFALVDKPQFSKDRDTIDKFKYVSMYFLKEFDVGQFGYRAIHKNNEFDFTLFCNGKLKIGYTIEHFDKKSIFIAKSLKDIMHKNFLYVEEREHISFSDFIQFCKKHIILE